VEFNSFGPAVGRLGSDSSRGGQSRSRGAQPPLAPLTLTTGPVLGLGLAVSWTSLQSVEPEFTRVPHGVCSRRCASPAAALLCCSSHAAASTDGRTNGHGTVLICSRYTWPVYSIRICGDSRKSRQIGRCFRFVCIYACAVCFCVAACYRFSR